ncbi:MAG: response regulator transcription factor [Chloroflexota bacterium]
MVRVLVVSDRALVRAGLTSMLAGADGLEVVGESTLAEALAEVDARAPEAAVVDVGEDEEGPEALWRLAGERPGVAIVALAQSAREARARQALQAGARAYLLWDAGPDEVAAALHAVSLGLVVLEPSVAESFWSQEAGLPPPPTGGETLSPREREVLQLLAQGLASKTIASRLRVSEHTVKFHIGSILNKLGAASRTEAVTVAIRRGLITI